MSPDEMTLLAHAAANGDDHALHDLVVATQDTVHRLCAHLASAADAEDLTQDTYLRALQALPRYRGDAPVIVWLLGIARHVCADHIRRRDRRAPLDRKVAASTDRVVAARAIETTDLLRILDEERRAAFVLTQMLGFSYDEAAVICDCPVGTIRSRVARARGILAYELEKVEAV